jgi:hypothetical protein
MTYLLLVIPTEAERSERSGGACCFLDSDKFRRQVCPHP